MGSGLEMLHFILNNWNQVFSKDPPLAENIIIIPLSGIKDTQIHIALLVTTPTENFAGSFCCKMRL
ncbi:hypothetical protein AMJ80_08960 [bacterium SM23_31]|nr:MAG: hypothetical protein AMJ80_08960 [bacterium SM23_31]